MSTHVTSGHQKLTPDESSPIRTYGVKINVDDMERALSFYCDKLGFEVKVRRSEREIFAGIYPWRHKDKSFGFMLHYRSSVHAIKNEYPRALSY